MITRGEIRWVWWFVAILLGITLFPYLLGFALQGEAWRFTGFVFGVEDGNSYIAKMLWGATGSWLFRTPYTAYAQNGFLAFLPYLLLGKLTSAPAQHEQLVALFQIFRCLGGAAMIWASYHFLALIFEDVRIRRWGIVLITAGGGLGWGAVVGLQGIWSKGLPLEFYSPETFGFLSLFGLPHLSAGRALLLWGIILYLRLGKQKITTLRQSIKPGLLWLALGLFQPLTIVTGWAVLAMHLFLLGAGMMLLRLRRVTRDWQSWRNYFKVAATMVVISSPMVIYTVVSFSTDPFLREWSGQNIILSPPPGDYLLAFAVILPFVLWGFLRGVDYPRVESVLLMGWVILFPFLAYAPYNLQRRLPDGVWLALVCLGLFGLIAVKSKGWRWLSSVWLTLGLLPALIFWVGSLFTVMQVQAPLYRPAAEVDAFLFLSENAPVDAVVLTNYDSANALPAWAPLRVLTGHGPESIRLAKVQPLVDDFLENRMTRKEQEEFISEFNIQFVLINSRDALEFLVDDKFESVYNREGYFIYTIRDAQ